MRRKFTFLPSTATAILPIVSQFVAPPKKYLDVSGLQIGFFCIFSVMIKECQFKASSQASRQELHKHHSRSPVDTC